MNLWNHIWLCLDLQRDVVMMWGLIVNYFCYVSPRCTPHTLTLLQSVVVSYCVALIQSFIYSLSIIHLHCIIYL